MMWISCLPLSGVGHVFRHDAVLSHQQSWTGLQVIDSLSEYAPFIWLWVQSVVQVYNTKTSKKAWKKSLKPSESKLVSHSFHVNLFMHYLL